MKIAIIKTGGKQYKVAEKTKLNIEKIEGNVGDKVVFDSVLLVADDENLELGQPLLPKKVEAKILQQGRAEKVLAVRYKAKTRQYKRHGHRQLFTRVEIEKIG